MATALIIQNLTMGDKFCYWDARNLPDTVILLCYFAVSFSILGVTLYRIKKVNRYGQNGRRIARIYILIILWSITFCFQMMLGSSIYLTVIQGDYSVDMGGYSRMYARIDVVPAFIIPTIFLSICKIFFRGLLSSIPIKLMAKWEIKFMSVLRVYYIARIIVIGICVLLLNIFVETEHATFYLTLTVNVLIADCGLSNVILVISLRIFMVRFTETNRFEEKDLKRLKRQYVIMIVVSMLRIINDLFFVTLPQFQIIPAGRCIGPFDENPQRTILFNFLGNLFNHILPIIWVLKIYNIASYQQSMNDSGHEEENDRMYLVQSFLRAPQ